MPQACAIFWTLQHESFVGHVTCSEQRIEAQADLTQIGLGNRGVRFEKEQLLHRQTCTPGTRVVLVDDIVAWAKSTAVDDPNVYWLFGHAGSGKSTVAYTIARRFEYAGDPTDTVILGGNFFCSRQFEETRFSKYIVRTIVHQLARKCKAFAEKLDSEKFDIDNQSIHDQLESLLIVPWQASERARSQHPRLADRRHGCLRQPFRGPLRLRGADQGEQRGYRAYVSRC